MSLLQADICNQLTGQFKFTPPPPPPLRTMSVIYSYKLQQGKVQYKISIAFAHQKVAVTKMTY